MSDLDRFGLPPKPAEIPEILQWIRDDLRSIMGKFDKMELSWDVQGNLETIKYYTKNVLQLTLTFTWDQGKLIKVERS